VPRSRQAEVQSVVSWHKLCARHRLSDGTGRGAKGGRVEPRIWNNLMRERVSGAWQ
jgi:hypothetical protein